MCVHVSLSTAGSNSIVCHLKVQFTHRIEVRYGRWTLNSQNMALAILLLLCFPVVIIQVEYNRDYQVHLTKVNNYNTYTGLSPLVWS